MSRSYRKNPVRKDNIRDGKKEAKRAVRRKESVASGAAYKKEYDSWDVVDLRFWESEEEFRREWERENGPVSGNEEKYKRDLFEWKKRYKNK